MLDELKELVKSANSKHDAIEMIHIEIQNLKIQLVNKGYKVITTPGKPGPHFDEIVDTSQNIHPDHVELVNNYKILRSLKDTLDGYANPIEGLERGKEQNEFLQIIETKA